MSMVRVLDEHTVRRLLPMADCIEAMDGALRSLARGEVYNPLRPVFRPPNEPSLMGLMPAHRGGDAPWWSLKALTIVPGNSSRGLDSHQGFVALFDGDTGEPRVLMNAGGITAIRTAAVSGVATRLLAREHVKTLAILGSGTQAVSHLDAMHAVRSFDRVVMWSASGRSLDGAESVETAEEAVRDADVICTTTASAEPIVQARMAEARRAHQRRRLEHPDRARARLADDGRRVALRRPPRVDPQRGGRLPDPAAGRADRPGQHPRRARRAAARHGRRPPVGRRDHVVQVARDRGGGPRRRRARARSAPRRRMRGRSSRCDPARRDPPGTRGARRRRGAHAARPARRRHGRRDLAEARAAAAGPVVQDPRRGQRGAAGDRRGARGRRAHRERREHGAGAVVRRAPPRRDRDDRRPRPRAADEDRRDRALRRPRDQGAVRRVVEHDGHRRLSGRRRAVRAPGRRRPRDGGQRHDRARARRAARRLRRGRRPLRRRRARHRHRERRQGAAAGGAVLLRRSPRPVRPLRRRSRPAARRPAWSTSRRSSTARAAAS